VYGNRFSGGGYGGCLFMLCDEGKADQIAESVIGQYIHQYPELEAGARVMRVASEGSVRIIQP